MPEYVLDTSDAPDIWRTLDAFTRGYIEAAMWTLIDTFRECDACGHRTHDNIDFQTERATDEDTCPECGEDALGDVQTDSRDDLSAGAIDISVIRAAVRDCGAFQAEFRADLDAATEEQGRDAACHGHDFWLTREGHGTGFWDRGYSEELSKRLTDGAHAYGEACWYVGDDGRVYSMDAEPEERVDR